MAYHMDQRCNHSKKIRKRENNGFGKVKRGVLEVKEDKGGVALGRTRGWHLKDK